MSVRRIVLRCCGRAATWTSVVLMLAIGPGAAQTPTAPGAPSVKSVAESFRGAVALERRGLYDLAVVEWQTLLDDHPHDPLAGQARFHRGVCLFKLEKYAEAASDFERLLADGTALDGGLREQAQANLGLAHYNRGRTSTEADRNAAFGAALAAFGEQLARYPDGPLAAQAIFYRAETQYARGELRSAAEGYRILLQKYADHPLRGPAHYGLGVVHQEGNRPAEAAAEFDRFLQQYPQHELAADARLRRGEVFRKLERLSDAEADFEAAASAEGFPAADRALQGLAECRAQAGDYARAAEVYAELVERFPASELVLAAAVAEGKYRFLNHQYTAAIHRLQKLQSHPDVGGEVAAEAAHWLTRAQLADGQKRAALMTAETALGRTPQPPASLLAQLRLDRADALFELAERKAEAVAHYAAIAREYPDETVAPQAAYMAGYAALAIGEAARAMEHADEFHRNFSTSDLLPDVDNVAAEAQLQLGNHAEAERRFRSLLRDYPQHAEHEDWLIRRAHCLSICGQPGDVVEALEPAWRRLATPERQVEAGLLLGKAHSAQDRHGKAVEVLTIAAALPRNASSDEVTLALAQAHQAQGGMTAAIATLSRLIDAEPRCVLADRALFARGECYAASGDYKSAAADFERLCDRNPNSPLLPHALLSQARAEQQQELLASAQRTLSRLITTFPHHKLATPARFTRATVRHGLRRWPEALSDIKVLLATRPPRAMRSDALLLRGMCQAELGREADAIQSFEVLLSEDTTYRAPDRVLYELAWAYDRCGKAEQATSTFRRLAKEHSESPLAAECWYRVGEAAYAASDFADAAECFRSCGRLAADAELQEKAAHKLGWAQFSQSSFADAERSFTEQLTRFPSGALAAEAWLMIAESRFGRHDDDAALEAYMAALDDQDARPEVRSLGMLHAAQSAARLEKWDACLALLERCEREYPKSPWDDAIRCERGAALYHRRQWDAARLEFEPLADQHAGELGARARFMLGEIQFACKQFDDAVRSFFKVAYGYGDEEASPDVRRWQAEAMFEAARCLELTERHDSARELYQELLTRFPDSAKAAHARVALGETTTR